MRAAWQVFGILLIATAIAGLVALLSLGCGGHGCPVVERRGEAPGPSSAGSGACPEPSSAGSGACPEEEPGDGGL